MSRYFPVLKVTVASAGVVFIINLAPPVQVTVAFVAPQGASEISPSDLSSTVIDVRFVQPSNAVEDIVFTDLGIVIDFKAVQFSNAVEFILVTEFPIVT